MVAMISAIRVKDYAQWKRGFDEGSELRRTSGMRAYQILQAVDDPSYLVLLTEYDTPEVGQKFLRSSALREASDQSGVIEMLPTHDAAMALRSVQRATV